MGGSIGLSFWGEGKRRALVVVVWTLERVVCRTPYSAAREPDAGTFLMFVKP